MSRLVSELMDDNLALWVARAQGWNVYFDDGKPWYILYAQDAGGEGPIGNAETGSAPLDNFAPHENWMQGGPIIKRANISLHPPTSPVHRCGGPNAGLGQSGVWSACTWTRGANGKRSFGMDDHSPLVAAMRCYVRFVFGDTVSDEVAP